MKFEVGVIQKDSWEYFEQFITEDGRNNGDIKLGLTSEGAACGAIAGHFASDTLFKVDSIYVACEARDQGGGTLLVESLLDQLHENDPTIAVKFEFLEMDADTEALYDFLLGKGFVEGESGKYVYIFSIEDFSEDKGFITGGDSDSFVSFENASKKELLELDKRCSDSGYTESVFGSFPGSIDKHSSIILKNKGRNVSFIAAEWVSDTVCMLNGFRIPGGKVDRFKNAIATVINRLEEKADHDTQILIRVTDDFERKALEGIFPEAENLYHNFVIV
ncbi:MAG: hypothetical protein K6C41_07810 [Lachnospiraceae bacterium]|nr:hypothetical protein [Lachnospiraceae bacterium]